MAQISVGAALGAGFNLIGRRPLSVIGWGAFTYGVLLVFILVAGLTLGFGVIAQLGSGATAAQAGAATARLLLTLWPLIILFVIGMFFLNAVIQAAVIRSVLEPQNKGFASIRLGSQEAALVLLYLVYILAFIVVEVASIIVFAVLGLLLRPLGYGGTMLLVLIGIAYWLTFGWIATRFALAAPMTFVERRVRFFGSWEATRGNGWGVYGLAWLVALTWIGCFIAWYIVNLIVSLLLVGAGMGAAIAGGLQSSAANPAALQALWPMLVIYGLFSLVAGSAFVGGSQALLQAPWAEAYRQLHGSPDVAATFS
jgi:hypothetical protein